MGLPRREVNRKTFLLLDKPPREGLQLRWGDLRAGFGVVACFVLVVGPFTPGILPVSGLVLVVLAALLVMLARAPASFRALASDGVYQLTSQGGTTRVKRKLAEASAVRGVALVPSQEFGRACWRPALVVEAHPPIFLGDSVEGREAARQVAAGLQAELGQPDLGETTTLAPVPRSGHLMVLQSDSPLEKALQLWMFLSLLVAGASGIFWSLSSIHGGYQFLGVLALVSVAALISLSVVRDRLEDFVVLDRSQRRLVFIRRFPGGERQTTVGQFEDVARAEIRQSGDPEFPTFEPVLVMRNGQVFPISHPVTEHGQAHVSASQAAEFVGCQYTPPASEPVPSELEPEPGWSELPAGVEDEVDPEPVQAVADPRDRIVVELDSTLERVLSGLAYLVLPGLVAAYVGWLLGSIGWTVSAGLLIFAGVLCGLLRLGLSDFLALDLVHREVLSIRRFGGSERATSVGRFEDVAATAVQCELDGPRSKGRVRSILYYYAVLALPGDRLVRIGTRSRDPAGPEKLAEEVARAIGCRALLAVPWERRSFQNGKLVTEAAGYSTSEKIYQWAIATYFAGLLLILLLFRFFK